MKDRFILGRYLNGDSLMHRLDPRLKLIGMVALLVIVLFANNIWSYGLLTLFILSLVKLTDLPLRLFLNSLRPMLVLILFTVVLQLFFTHSGEVIWQWRFLTLTSDGVQNAWMICCRFILIIFVSTILTLTTKPLEITDALEYLFSPLRKILPVHELALMLSIALRFVPTLIEETDKIMHAQRARGVSFDEGNLYQRIQAIVPILIPLFVSAFNRAFDLANAMEARGYRGAEGRSKYRQAHWQKGDSVALLVLTIVCAGVMRLTYL